MSIRYIFNFYFIVLISQLFSKTEAGNPIFNYGDFSCGRVEQSDLKELIHHYEMFKKDPNGFVVPTLAPHTTTRKSYTTTIETTTYETPTHRPTTTKKPSEIAWLVESKKNKPISYFLEKSKYLRNVAIERILEIEYETLNYEWFKLLNQIESRSAQIRCETMKTFAESLAMEMLAFEHNMIDLTDSIDPNIDFDLKLKTFFQKDSKQFDMDQFDSLGKEINNLLKDPSDRDRKKQIMLKLTDIKLTWEDELLSLFKNVIVPELDLLYKIDKELSIEDRVQIRSIIKFIVWIKGYLDDVEKNVDSLI